MHLPVILTAVLSATSTAPAAQPTAAAVSQQANIQSEASTTQPALEMQARQLLPFPPFNDPSTAEISVLPCLVAPCPYINGKHETVFPTFAHDLSTAIASERTEEATTTTKTGNLETFPTISGTPSLSLSDRVFTTVAEKEDGYAIQTSPPTPI